MLRYIGKKGIFEYDEEVWYLDDEDRLRFNDSYVGPIDIPKGMVKSLDYAFFECDVQYGCYLRHFSTAGVDSMNFMFANCVLPVGFTFPQNFYTEGADTQGMFLGCYFSERGCLAYA